MAKETARQAVLPTYEQALEQILHYAPQLSTEKVALDEALGRVLVQDVPADRDQPPFDRSAMDGFALGNSQFDAKQTFAVTGTVAAGASAPSSTADSNGVLRIATGAALPPGYDVVIPIEQAEVTEQDNGEKVHFTVSSVRPWQHIHRRASDAEAGDVVIKAGTQLGPQHLGIAAAVGAVELMVCRLPRIVLLSTGDEVVDTTLPTEKLEPQQIRNSNAPLLRGFFRSLGVPVLHHEHVPDDPEPIRAAAREALSRAHLVITIGGVSVGQRDFLPWAWKQLGLHTVLHGVAIKPGKPLFIATPVDPKEPEQRDNKLVIGLPGNPVSVLTTAHLFVWPVIRAMLGMDAALPWRAVEIAEPVNSKAQRQVFRSVRLQNDGRASLIDWQGSGDLMHTAEACGWIRLPQKDGTVEAGTRLPFLPMAGGVGV